MSLIISPPTPNVFGGKGMSSSQLQMRPAGVSCEKYVAGADGRRCRHYLDNGACTLPGEFMCVEWVKRNPRKPGPRTTEGYPLGEPM